MKKLLSAILAVLMIVSLAACTKPAEPDKPAEEGGKNNIFGSLFGRRPGSEAGDDAQERHQGDVEQGDAVFEGGDFPAHLFAQSLDVAVGLRLLLTVSGDGLPLFA